MLTVLDCSNFLLMVDEAGEPQVSCRNFFKNYVACDGAEKNAKGQGGAGGGQVGSSGRGTERLCWRSRLWSGLACTRFLWAGFL